MSGPETTDSREPSVAKTSDLRLVRARDGGADGGTLRDLSVPMEPTTPFELARFLVGYRDLKRLETDDPEQLGPYSLLARLPGGSHPTAKYLARHIETRALVVLKVLPPDCEPEARSQLHSEGAQAAKVRSPYVARVHEVDHDRRSGHLYLVQDFAHGQPLSEKLARSPLTRLRPEAAYRLAVGLLEAIQAVRDAHVAHCDVKPGNVILGPEHPILVDFGIARDYVAGAPEAVIGTAQYLSPEQVKTQPLDWRGDVFAWAVTVARGSLGVHPFDPVQRFKDDATGYAMHLAYDRPDPDLSQVPAPLRPILASALAHDAAKRPSIDRLLDRLYALQEREGWTLEAGFTADVPLASREADPPVAWGRSVVRELRAGWEELEVRVGSSAAWTAGVAAAAVLPALLFGVLLRALFVTLGIG